MTVKHLVKYALVVCGVLAAVQAQASFPTVPKETYEALKIDRSASPKELYEALLKRYLIRSKGSGRGNMATIGNRCPLAAILTRTPSISRRKQ